MVALPKSILTGVLICLLLGLDYTAPLGAPLDGYGLGSARYLEGRNVFYTMFVNTPESSWMQEDKQKALKNLQTATDYIEQSAQDYNIETEFIFDWNEYSNLSGDVGIDFKVSDNEDFQDKLDEKIAVWVKRTISFEALTKEYQGDGIALLVFINNNGSSYAIVYDGMDNPRESLVIFSDDPPSVYAHEILHLFGAHDLYPKAEYTVEVTDYIKQRYPLEIMYTITDAQGRKLSDSIVNEISPITAYHLGWIDYTEEVTLFPQLLRREE